MTALYLRGRMRVSIAACPSADTYRITRCCARAPICRNAMYSRASGRWSPGLDGLRYTWKSYETHRAQSIAVERRFACRVTPYTRFRALRCNGGCRGRWTARLDAALAL